MKRFAALLSLLFVPMLLATSAAADPGHLAEARGHTHLLALAAFVAALAIGLAGLIRHLARRRRDALPRRSAGTAE